MRELESRIEKKEVIFTIALLLFLGVLTLKTKIISHKYVAFINLNAFLYAISTNLITGEKFVKLYQNNFYFFYFRFLMFCLCLQRNT